MVRSKKGVRATRNHELVSGVPRFGSSWSASASRRYLHSKKGAKGKQTAPQKAKTAIVPLTKSRWYAADDVKVPLKSNKSHKPTKLRASITPGTVLIVLAGRFRGRRVIFLKQLDSGLLLISGPFAINGVPLRRVNQRYVIATSGVVDVSKADVSNINDAFFAKNEEEKKKNANGEFFEKKSEEKKELPAARKSAQKSVDSVLLASVKSLGAEFVAYLGARFSLTNGARPHALKF